MSFPFKILVAPLDWGLGHTSRCLPLVQELQKLGHEVTAAASGASAVLLKANFPDLRLIELSGYGITYSRNKQGFKLKILLQLPKLLLQIRKEHRWLKKELERHPYDLIISDNRYGLHNTGVYSIIMTHQLQILTGMGRFNEKLIRKLHYRLLEKFDRCWVVDKAGEGLSGRLAHPPVLPRNAEYIGWLSQLAMSTTEEEETPRGHFGPGSESEQLRPEQLDTAERHIMVLLSGPEPLRSLLEEKLWSQLAIFSHKRFIFIAGKPGAVAPGKVLAHVRYFSHLNAQDLKAWMRTAELVICRSGYSTLMDLAAMGKKALLVPTPGQTEQEYLAKYLHARRFALYRTQKELSLVGDIILASTFSGFKQPTSDFHQDMKRVLNALPEKLAGRKMKS